MQARRVVVLYYLPMVIIMMEMMLRMLHIRNARELQPSVRLPYVDFLQSFESSQAMIADDRRPSRFAVLKIQSVTENAIDGPAFAANVTSYNAFGILTPVNRQLYVALMMTRCTALSHRFTLKGAACNVIFTITLQFISSPIFWNGTVTISGCSKKNQ
jgi:hypothetical protein